MFISKTLTGLSDAVRYWKNLLADLSEFEEPDSVEGRFLGAVFENVEELDIIENHYASDTNWYNYRISICRNLKNDSSKLKQLLKQRYFNINSLA